MTNFLRFFKFDFGSGGETPRTNANLILGRAENPPRTNSNLNLRAMGLLLSAVKRIFVGEEKKLKFRVKACRKKETLKT